MFEIHAKITDPLSCSDTLAHIPTVCASNIIDARNRFQARTVASLKEWESHNPLFRSEDGIYYIRFCVYFGNEYLFGFDRHIHFDRENGTIGTPSYVWSGDYTDLTNKPTIPEVES